MGTIDRLLSNELQLTNKFELSFTDNPDLTYFVKSTNLPIPGLSQEVLPFGNKKLTGYVPVETVTITFWETVDLAVYSFFREWQEKIFDFDKKVFKVLQSEYDKYKTATITTKYSNIGGRILSGIRFRLTDVTPLTIEEYTFDEETGEPLFTIVNLSIGNVTPE
jgi:hypothetical protein